MRELFVAIERDGENQRFVGRGKKSRNHRGTAVLEGSAQRAGAAAGGSGSEDGVGSRRLADRNCTGRLSEQHGSVTMKDPNHPALADVDTLEKPPQLGRDERRDNGAVDGAVLQGEPPGDRNDPVERFDDSFDGIADEEASLGLLSASRTM